MKLGKKRCGSGVWGNLEGNEGVIWVKYIVFINDIIKQ